MKHQVINPIIDYSVKNLCVKPYYNHKKGCPNWNKRNSCPPAAFKFEDIIDIEKPIYCIWNRFYLSEHVERMKIKHPGWSEYQLKCCLYWQGTARKQLNEKLEMYYSHSGLEVMTCPEAYGINVTETMKLIGIELEWPPVRYSYQVALAGYTNLKDL